MKIFVMLVVLALGGLAEKSQAQRLDRNDRWVLCANEGGYCSVRGSTSVVYGANGRFITRQVYGGVACNSQSFGDPIPGVRKACFALERYQPQPPPYDDWSTALAKMKCVDFPIMEFIQFDMEPTAATFTNRLAAKFHAPTAPSATRFSA